MEAPYCKICDHNHWGVDHVWPKVGEVKASVVPDAGIQESAGVVKPAPKATARKLKPMETREEYNARMREYMRKWRLRSKSS